MRYIIILLLATSVGGCATFHDPDFWAAMAGGAAAGAGNTGNAIRASQQQNDAVLQRSADGAAPP